MVDTPLARRLAETPARPDPLSAFKIARHAFLEGRRIEMQELAAEVGVNRATLFRWVGSRDHLLTEVVWSVTEPTFLAVADRVRGRGARRVATVMGGFARAVIGSSFFPTWVHSEPERALRILTTKASPFQARMVGLVERLVGEEVDAGRLSLSLPSHDTAYLIVRIGEAFIYADLITGEPPDATKVTQAVAALLD
ncbi:MAG: QsdR family transcriptional regulator [Nocardioides sp.]|uniref:QsdR family transcriptional regulator n=1 Tax=Nocardioides sp. TaxID=35761 RepID=UPI0039E6AEC0